MATLGLIFQLEVISLCAQGFRKQIQLFESPMQFETAWKESAALNNHVFNEGLVQRGKS